VLDARTLAYKGVCMCVYAVLCMGVCCAVVCVCACLSVCRVRLVFAFVVGIQQLFFLSSQKKYMLFLVCCCVCVCVCVCVAICVCVYVCMYVDGRSIPVEHRPSTEGHYYHRNVATYYYSHSLSLSLSPPSLSLLLCPTC
jgi:hypothetical protein